MNRLTNDARIFARMAAHARFPEVNEDMTASDPEVRKQFDLYREEKRLEFLQRNKVPDVQVQASRIVCVPTNELLNLLSRATNTLEPIVQPKWVQELLHPTDSPIPPDLFEECVLIFAASKK